MIEILQQPRSSAPLTKSRPIVYKILGDEHIIDEGARPTFSLTFQTGSGSAGDVITVMGIEVTTVAGDFTDTEFDNTGTVEECAESFAGFLKSNPTFADFMIFVSFAGGDATVTAISNNFEEIEPAQWDFDYAGLSNTNTHTETNGQFVNLANVQLWYQVYTDEQKVSDRRWAEFGYDANNPTDSGFAEFDIAQICRSVLDTRPPDLGLVGLEIDPRYMKRFHVRFGTVAIDETCNAIANRTYFTDPVNVTNSVFQLPNSREFLDHAPQTVSLVKWLTDRPDGLVLAMDTKEWMYIYIERTEAIVGDFIFRFKYYDEDGTLIADEYLTTTDDGVYCVPCGPANAPGFPNGCKRYEVQVFGEDELAAEVEYSEMFTRNVKKFQCEYEVYFQEDSGAYITIELEKREVSQTVVRDNYSVPVNLESDEPSALYIEGGGLNVVEESEQYIVFESHKIMPGGRKVFEMLARSNNIFIKDSAFGSDKIRRLVLEGGDFVTQAGGEAVRFRGRFMYNTGVIVH